MANTVVFENELNENTGYRFSWGLAMAGGVAATAVTFFLLTLGSGVGLLLVHPVAHNGPGAPVFLTGGAIYFLVTQAFGFAVGGHFAGRLLGPLVESQTQEDFRAVAHGFVAWAVAVLSTLTIVVFAGLTAAKTGAATAALYGAVSPITESAGPTAYLVDKLFRPGDDRVAATDTGTGAKERAEAGRILEAGLAHGEQLTADDHARLVAVVGEQAGVSRDVAAKRIEIMQSDIQSKSKKAADIARKTASFASLWVALSLMFGAVVAMAAAVLARNEDDRESVGDRRR